MKCKQCFRNFKKKYYNHTFCSVLCRDNYHKAIAYEDNQEYVQIDSGKTGAISELMVCADLMKKGYEVYRAVSQSSSCDLVIQKNTKITSIEVRTGFISNLGKIQYPKNNIKASCLAVFIRRDNSIYYFPNIEETQK